MTVTAALVRDNILAPAMDSIAHNLDQFNPTPQADSHLEYLLDALGRGDLEAARIHCSLAIESNLLEREATSKVTQFSDELTTEIHRIETESGPGEFSTKAICLRLRDPLKVIRNPTECSVREITFAHLIVKDAVRDIPVTELTKGNVRRDLGAKLFEVLSQYIEGMDA